MCIIVYKPKGHNLPSKSILKTCFENNPDGVGYMFNDGEKVIIEKGFMNFNEFYREIKSYIFYANDLVIHFRWATQGASTPQNTHPFPLTKTIKKLQALELSTTIGIAHNGIINFCKNTNKRYDLSDTQIFIKDYLSKISKNKIKGNSIFDGTNSKFAIMDKNEVWLEGYDWIKKDGIFYSNSTFERYRIMG